MKISISRDTDDRLKRAKKLGFDIKHQYVHVSPHVLPQHLSNDLTLYVTDNKEYAQRYAKPTASSMGGKDKEYFTNLSPTSTPLYVKVGRMFDTRKAKDRALFYSHFFEKYGNGTPLQPTGLPDWVEAEGFRDFFEDLDLDYDGVIVDEGHDPTDGGAKHRGFSIAIFNQSAAKSIFAKFEKNNNDMLAGKLI